MIALLIDHLWQSTVVAFAAWVLVVPLRRREARVRYWVWFAASMKFLVPFAALVAIGSELDWRVNAPTRALFEPSWNAFAEQVAQPITALVPAAAPAAAAGIAAEDRIATAVIVGAVWIVGFALVLGRWLERLVRLGRLVRLAAPVALAQLAGGGIEARLSKSKIEPGIVGIFRPVLILPEGILERLTAQQLHAVIEHELCHVRRRDNLTAALHMGVAAVFWFHPLVWWIGARLIEERERACDEAVVASGVDPGAYAQGIIEVCRLYVESPLPCAAGIGGGATLKARVRSIADNCTARRLGLVWRAALATSAMLAVGAPLAIGVLTAPSIAAQSADADRAAVAAATIAESEDETAASFRTMNYGVLTTTNESLRQLIVFAYGLQNYEIAGPPGLDSRRYSIHATTADTKPNTDDYRRLMRTLLEQRFGLEFHRETQRRPVLVLTRLSDALGPGIVRVAANTVGGGAYSRREARSMVVTNQPMSSLTSWLSNVLGKPVLDGTGLREAYSFEVRWESSVASGTQPPADEVTRALESQLELALTEAQRSVEVLVVDRFTEPSDPLTVKTAIALPSEVLDRHAGYYGVLSIDWIMIVRSSGDHLVAEPLGEPPIALYPLTEARFFAPAGDADATFVDGDMPALLWRRAGNVRSLRRIDTATAEARLAELRGRVERQAPLPGGEAIVRAIARDLASEQRVQSVTDFTGRLRDALRSEAPAAFAERGALRSVTFKRVEATGRNDVYEVAFENLTFDVLLGLDAEGKVSSLDHILAGRPD